VLIDDRWVVERRVPKAVLDPTRAYAAVWEEEPDASGALVPTAVVFLTNRECPFRCVMCDLWVNTLDEDVPRGAIAGQIRAALAQLPPAPAFARAPVGTRQIKLYNAGSFFDPHAIPPEDDDEIAEVVSGFARVIVEAHPAFLTGVHADRCLRFRDLLNGRLEVAIGLETAHPEVLARLNKRMTLDTFRRAAGFLADNDIDLRAFILLAPPFLPGDEAVEWACRSLDYAADCGATACSVIPTRSGNGAMEALAGEFQPPRLQALEAAIEHGLAARAGPRVFADLWDIERFFDCDCSPARAARLRQMNCTQRTAPPVACSCTTATSR
jgi:archaeosine synthase beta-subunit